MNNPRIVALIPARSGSERVINKNIRVLGGHPLMAYTIAAAGDSGVFDAIIVSTDHEDYAKIARHYGAEVPFMRPSKYAHSAALDIDFVAHALDQLEAVGRTFECFSILRPTSPFRQAETIQRAWNAFRKEKGVDSLRAVELCRQHPAKMWIVRNNRMNPILPLGPPERPWHSSPYASLPQVYVQNASLEIAWARVARDDRTIAGNIVMPFLTKGHEGFDINDSDDWLLAELLTKHRKAQLPAVSHRPYS